MQLNYARSTMDCAAQPDSANITITIRGKVSIVILTWWIPMVRTRFTLLTKTKYFPFKAKVHLHLWLTDIYWSKENLCLNLLAQTMWYGLYSDLTCPEGEVTIYGWSRENKLAYEYAGWFRWTLQGIPDTEVELP